ncbi:MAG TPA: UDP-N-acetylmuramoyl-L-alanine--D-glutamate ligase [Candidatus Polarisedimenticolaceae bacterium]|nr:UDP-N-acetylmuramoyl-L-alanine--D-glutamate ligase [Candidatus Polarisedimenticolaceae bacterium]
MTAPRTFARHAPDLGDVRVLVVGLGKSGIAAARLLAARGALVQAADRRPAAELASAEQALAGSGVEVVPGGHPATLAEGAELVVTSPGVPADTPVLAAARAAGIPVWSEVELAFRFLRGRVVGITGSNGKSTTTSMIGTILRTAGLPGGTGGNLGTPLSTLLAEDGPDAVHAVELSSFQLEWVEAFRARVGVVVNFSPDHLDRHGSLEAYATAKARLLDRQEPGDAAVLNADDPESRRFESHVRGQLFTFSTRGPVPGGAGIEDGMLVVRGIPLLPAASLPVPGEHNVANALAAGLACDLAGVAGESIARGLAMFRALPHRLQKVGSVRGVDYYDDSKATNLDATARALASFPPRSVHLILGGKDKGGNWTSLASLARRHARRILLVGEAAPVIRRALEGVVPLEDCGTVQAAVRTAAQTAGPGEIVLLAPGCASFDQYRNFEERGDDFARAVTALA